MNSKSTIHFAILRLMVGVILLSLFFPFTSMSEDKLLVTAGPSWQGFTNQDGTGVYHDIIRLIFSPEYSIKHVYTTSDQANALVSGGRADIKMCENEILPALLLGKYPLYENAYYAVFRINENNQWEGVKSLKGHQVSWRIGYYSQKDFPVEVVPRPVPSGEAALMMVALGRADYYIDDVVLIEQSFSRTEDSLNREDFAFKEVGRRKYYPVFSDSQRGRILKEKYDSGIEHLYSSGRLSSIYNRFQIPQPKLKIP